MADGHQTDADALETRYRSRGFWLDTVPGSLRPRPSLSGDLDVDVAVVGAGFTGLWTAYSLAKADPSLRVAVLEAEIAGFGASGRNGGWCSALVAMSKERIARDAGRQAAIDMQRAMVDTVDEVGRVCEAEGIDAHFHKGGDLILATTPAHVDRVREEVESERAWGFGEDHIRWLDAKEASARVGVAGTLGGAYSPHCARVHPARLARGLAEAVERAGATIYERTPALQIERGGVRTHAGRVRAEVVVRATEGYTTTLAGMRRDVAPVYSQMIATEPLPSSFWDGVGWADRETLTDGRHALFYAQRTQDDRIAFGGGSRSVAQYHFRSAIDDRFDAPHGRVLHQMKRVLVSLFPQLGGRRITHAWGGPLGIPRDWYSSVGLDRERGLAWAGGYVGDGVATANLAGRTLADLILGRHTDLVRLPWVGHRSAPWEPEPLRWAGVNLGRVFVASADPLERRTGRPARYVDLIERLRGG